ncbi:hypothetical protein KPH14_003454 [Odynerus spinipes]|uniref:Ubiquitin-associated domain-containing protein 1 n=1 Tax=Odynerus spinipes TaxID=1348599 RepID=A0AAD9VKP3_9HYME|nr:hypothetical protein KPH14_003454 [Odynerus spinipes]
MLMSLPPTPEGFSVNVISLEGDVLGIGVKPDFTIEKIKEIAMKHFYGQDISKPISQFRLIHSSKFKQLIDDKNVDDQEIDEHDELILVEIRPASVKENLSEEALRGPTEETIANATSGLEIKNPPRPIPSVDCPTDFQNEIRKILITLVQASARILMHSSEAGKFYEIIKEKLESRCKPNIDPKVMKTLIEMGYSPKKVITALRLRKSNMTEALEWLIEHQDDPDDNDKDDMTVLVDTNTDINVPGPSSLPGVRKLTLKEACADLFSGDKKVPEINENLINIVNLLLESFRQYKKLNFKPNQKLIESLLEMGFEEKDIIGALKVTGNNQSNACEWLLGERRPSLQDLDVGLDPEGSIYKAIMSNPHIQLSLTNSKMLLAYLSMLETPTSTSVWINDPEVSPVLSQIFKTYSAEKHAIHMNHPAGNIWNVICATRVFTNFCRTMVYYFTSEVVQPPVTLFMGVDKYENEDLIRWGWPEDVWFHVEKHSSAHVYLRLHAGQTIDDIPSTVLEDAAQLVKANSIEGNKMNDVDVVYTMWSNLKKTQGMEVGQVGFHKEKDVRKIHVTKRLNSIVNRLTKTKRSEQVNLRAEREQRDKNEREDKKKLLREQKEREKAEEKRRQEEAEMRSYNSLFNSSNMTSNTENSTYCSIYFN